jgi:hypothetical protein
MFLAFSFRMETFPFFLRSRLAITTSAENFWHRWWVLTQVLSADPGDECWTRWWGADLGDKCKPRWWVLTQVMSSDQGDYCWPSWWVQTQVITADPGALACLGNLNAQALFLWTKWSNRLLPKTGVFVNMKQPRRPMKLYRDAGWQTVNVMSKVLKA